MIILLMKNINWKEICKNSDVKLQKIIILDDLGMYHCFWRLSNFDPIFFIKETISLSILLALEKHFSAAQ